MQLPVIDLSECVDCEVCTDLCPKVFRRNDAGNIEIMELSQYPEEEIDEVIKNCPADCIAWEEV